MLLQKQFQLRRGIFATIVSSLSGGICDQIYNACVLLSRNCFFNEDNNSLASQMITFYMIETIEKALSMVKTLPELWLCIFRVLRHNRPEGLNIKQVPR